MSWRNLFNVKTATPLKPDPQPDPQRRTRGAALEAGQQPPPTEPPKGEESKGVFITGQSLMTFPVATTAILVVWKVIESLMPAWKGWLWIPAILALLLGAFFIFVSLSDPKAEKTSQALVTAIVVGTINACYLFASATGILGSVNVGNPPTPTTVQRAARTSGP